MFAQRFVANFKKACLPAGKGKRAKIQRVDIVAEQVKRVLETEDQKLILMVRG